MLRPSFDFGHRLGARRLADRRENDALGQDSLKGRLHSGNEVRIDGDEQFLSVPFFASLVSILVLAQSFAKVLVVPIPRLVPFARQLQEGLHVPVEIRSDLVPVAVDEGEFMFQKVLLELFHVDQRFGEIR